MGNEFTPAMDKGNGDTSESGSTTTNVGQPEEAAKAQRTASEQLGSGANVPLRSGEAGLRFNRVFTVPGRDPVEATAMVERSSVISNPDGSTVFRMDKVEVPETWSQLATDIVVSKYFRKTEVPGSGHETSVRQVVRRVARSIRRSGEQQGGYFTSPEDAETFEAELSYLLINQMGAFNSPAWFNAGLAEEYGIKGRPVGNFCFDAEQGQIVPTTDSYTHPQISACFIQSIEDDLMDIAASVQREMRLFKFGSGTGTNFSKIRAEGETLSAGGTSSGLMSFLEILDKAAGATKSGGTTRRAAKMVCLDADHPDIERFIEWKSREEEKARILIEKGGFPADFNGEAYRTISGQNSNNSVRVTDAFMKKVVSGDTWTTHWRTTGEPARQHKASDLWGKLATAAWRCADPGLQFDTTINAWHTCARTGRINASNPCSEYMFLDDTACNLASINLMKFVRKDGAIEIDSLRHAIRIFLLAQEIIIDYASYPTEAIGRNSHDFRPLGLGYANLGSLLMVGGHPYDSNEGRSIAASISAILCGQAYAVSAEIAASKGPFPGYAPNRDCMLGVMNRHRDAAHNIDAKHCPPDLYRAARSDWDLAVALGEMHGYRNAQTTVIAPTGTIGLLMDCDTTGIEPEFSLVKWKKLAGGGYFKIVNQSVPTALKGLGYDSKQVQDIIAWVTGTTSLQDVPHLDHAALRAKGLTDEDIVRVESALPKSFEISHAFAPNILGTAAMARLGIAEDEAADPGFDLLSRLGFSPQQIAEAHEVACGRMTIEGAPHIKDEHLAVFDCANKCGRTGQRFLAPMAHVRMMESVQPFISGSISKTVNIPNEATEADIEDIHMEAWKRGLKCIAIYRDGSKASQPLSSRSESADEKSTEQASDTEAQTDDYAKNLERMRLPKKRRGFTQEVRIGGQKVYLRTGEYADGSLGEIFIDVAKEGAAYRSIMNCFAIAVSAGLQHGVPLQSFVDMFTFTRFEPQGTTDHPNIKVCTSIIDYIFRLLGMEYMGRTDFIQVPPDMEDLELRRHQLEVEIGRMADERRKAAASGTGVTSERTASQASAPSPSQQAETPTSITNSATSARFSVLNEHMSELMGDAPFCDNCGHITVRNGACYKCLNCGASLGCS